MKLTTTLARIRSHSPCKSGYTRLARSLGGVRAYGADTPINLLAILDANGVQDMLWCLRATIEDSRAVAAQLAIEFATQALPSFEARQPNNDRPRRAIQAAREYLAGKIDADELHAARAAIYLADEAKRPYACASDTAAADAAAATAAADAATVAADATAAADAADAACYAASYASYIDYGKSVARQEKIIRSIISFDIEKGKS